MPINVSISGLTEAIGAAEGQIATITTTAMRGATDTLKQTLRDQIRDAGMGNRLANTWRADTYPDGRNSLNPAGYAWSNAPDIIDAFARGATITPLAGKNYLWLPTKSVPRAGGRSSSKSMTPDQVLETFGATEFVIKKGKGGGLLAFIVEGRGQTKRGAVKRVRKGRLAHGDSGQLVLMFVLKPSIRLPKKLDLQAAGDAGAADFVQRLEEGLA
ncbi:DUF6441 family protein [uncultured Sphingomonas sp.]|uniref:DUF6441 family protein n=1 Tax=uncultured Sphingomonas sp. TaxID=158754 RepID=UPI002610A53B|nr:DUF6441 family protein [uncultured Sphingomonas sp.]